MDTDDWPETVTAVVNRIKLTTALESMAVLVQTPVSARFLKTGLRGDSVFGYHNED